MLRGLNEEIGQEDKAQVGGGGHLEGKPCPLSVG